MKFWGSVLGLAFASSLLVASTASAGGMQTPDPRDTVGSVRDISGGLVWFLRSSNDPACATPVIDVVGLGGTGDTPVVMDTDGDGESQIGVYRISGGIGTFIIATDNTTAGTASPVLISFGGAAGDQPVTGDFDTGATGDEVAVYRNNAFILFDGTVISLGDPGDIPIAGNWDGSSDGSDEVGVYRPSNGTFYLRADNIPDTVGTQSTITTAGLGGDASDTPNAGDFDRDGEATPGIHRNTAQFFLSNATPPGVSVDEAPFFGGTSDVGVVGDWDGPNTDEAGCGT